MTSTAHRRRMVGLGVNECPEEEVEGVKVEGVNES